MYLGQAHNIAERREDKDPLAEELVCDAVHKLSSIEAAQEVLLPLPDGVEPVDSASHDLRVQLPASIASILQQPYMVIHPLEVEPETSEPCEAGSGQVRLDASMAR